MYSKSIVSGEIRLSRSATTVKGEIACLKTEMRAIDKGFIVSKPYIECRYDRIIDDGKKLHRVQIKYAGNKRGGTSNVKLYKYSKNGNKKGQDKPSTYSKDEIDAVLVYIEEINKVCWFPSDVFDGKKELNIRTSPSKNGQTKGCLFASDYIW